LEAGWAQRVEVEQNQSKKYNYLEFTGGRNS